MIKTCGNNVENDLVLVDKPVGITSFDVIRILRRKLGIRKMGHAGTLDPFASGLLIVGVGSGTKKLAGLIGLDKVYKAEVLIGISTTTGDPEGEVVEQAEGVKLTEESVERALSKMQGQLDLIPPKFSAIKKDGKPLYKYAREGKEVFIEPRPMTVHSYDDVSLKGNIINVTWNVGSGTYVRSLAEELGRRLGYPASLKNLRRISVGNFNVVDAIEIKK